MLSAFNIKKVIDEHTGKEIEPVIGEKTGLLSHPLDFQARITARSEKYAEMIRQVQVELPWGEGDARYLPTL